MLSTLVLATLASLHSALPAPAQATAVAAGAAGVADVTGTWKGSVQVPGQSDPDAFVLTLEPRADGKLEGRFRSTLGNADFRADWDAGERALAFACDFGSGTAVDFALTLEGEELAGSPGAPLVAGLRAKRASREAVAQPPIEVDLSRPRPVSVDLGGLPDFWEEPIVALVDATLAAEAIVGLSMAIAADGELLDVRSFGWQDYHGNEPASGRTMYRWASIGKSVTATLALQLVEEGKLDLERDVREYVPEFPAKQFPFSARQLLCHQAGIVHYQHGPVRTERTYERENPFADRILALDMFKESPLLFEPDTSYSYSTHGYVLLGAVVERAGGAPFDEQLAERIAKPLGLETFQPDHPTTEIPERTLGYCVRADGSAVLGGDSNVSWKVPGGGYISTVAELARYGAAFCDEGLLSAESRRAMWTEQRTKDGTGHGYGFGFGVGELEGRRVVSHSGGQRKTSTFLIVCPDLKLVVALMCNTQGAGLGDLARAILAEMIG